MHAALWRFRSTYLIAAAALALSVLLPKCEGGGSHPFTRATAAVTSTQVCPVKPVAQCIITRPGAFGTVDVAAAGASPGTPWAVSDPGGALMAYVNLYELASVGDGGAMPGGLVCSTYGFAANVACLTPRGTLVLEPTGPNGPTGPPVVLTAGDIAWIHRAEKVIGRLLYEHR